MFRGKLTLLALAAVVAGLAVLLPAATSARTTRPAIKAIEVGYFGSGLLAHRIDVFVYTRLGSRANVRVCVKGVCERARGHAGPTLAWYSASFQTRPLPMGASVTFSAVASNSAGRVQTKVTQGLLCMHNDGSTPQA